MTAIPSHGQPLEPAFCRRSGCEANTASPFCSGCGADIAAYLRATTAAHPMVAADAQAGDPQPLWSRPAGPRPATPGLASRAPAQQSDTADPPVVEDRQQATWRQPLVLTAFALSCATGAVVAVVAGLV